MAWKPNAQDTAVIAAIRWLTSTLENLGTNLYLTDRSRYPEIAAVLKAAVVDFDNMRTIGNLNSDCPPGYVDCNGVCEPMCLQNLAAASAYTVQSKKRGATKKR